jgi:hypothetical protein
MNRYGERHCEHRGSKAWHTGKQQAIITMITLIHYLSLPYLSPSSCAPYLLMHAMSHQSSLNDA